MLIGAVWTFQGLGYLEGSAMTGVDTWAMIGPIVAGLGCCAGDRGRAGRGSTLRSTRRRRQKVFKVRRG